jgi:hypothetical protein
VTNCEKIIPGTDRVCGQDSDIPWHIRFCSEECADRSNRAELAELGITPEMMKEALGGYYECKEMLDKQEATNDEASASQLPSCLPPPQQAPS